MAAVKTRALVLSERPFQDHDRMVTLFTEAEGKVSAIVKGARNPRSQLASATRLFAWSEFVYWPGKNFARIQEASLIDSFYSISDDLDRMMLASYPLELTNTFYDENQGDAALLKILVFLLFYMAHEPDTEPELLAAAFQLKLADAVGIRPDLTLPETGDSFYFSIDEGCFTGSRTPEGYQYRIDRSTALLMQKLLFTPISRLRTEEAPPEQLKSILGIMNHFLSSEAGRRFKTYEMYKESRNLAAAAGKQ
ncbi:MAG: DNA repair protein RecO [Eubacteriaceae bacterium]|jgi:DNA repair protein RecO (recombination protein O)